MTETTMSIVERWKKRMGYLFVLECNYAQESATETTMSIVERWKEEKYGLSFCSRVQSCTGNDVTTPSLDFSLSLVIVADVFAKVTVKFRK